MFVHLNKKIAIPNCELVRSVAWSWKHDFIACGGDNGVLKVIKLQTQWNQPQSNKNFSHNQTLESHKTHVRRVCWNEPFQKLTSSDEAGSIIVWTLYKGMWYEEMVNNRQRSLVTGMAWTRDGQRICIVYDDGNIITGSVEGNRIWGKDIKNVSFNQVEWSPDGKIILIGTMDFEVYIYDFSGNFIRKMHISRGAHDDDAKLIGIKWSNLSSKEPNDSGRRLLFAFDDGFLHLFKDDHDDYSLNVQTDLHLTSVEWNFVGDIFAVSGRSRVGALSTAIRKDETSSSRNYLKLYNTDGNVLHIVKVPGNELSDCSWDRNGLRLALAVDSYLFFAQIRAAYHWAFLEHSIVFVLPDHYNATPESGKRLIFWEIGTNNKYETQMKHYCQLASYQSYCAVVSKIYPLKKTFSSDSETTEMELPFMENLNGRPMFCLSILNSCGTLIDLHTIDMPVRHCALNSTRLIVTSDDSLYIWNYGDSLPARKEFGNRTRSEKLLSELTLDESSLEHSLFSETASAPVRTLEYSSGSGQGVKLISKNDPITCITASEKSFLLAHNSGVINQYALPSAMLMHSIQTNNAKLSLENTVRPSNGADIRLLTLNQNCSRFAMLNRSGRLYCYDFEANNEETNREGKWLTIGKSQDVWDIKWSLDHPDYLTIYEKNRIFIIDASKSGGDGTITPEANTTSEEPSGGSGPITNAYIASLERFVLCCVNLDSLIIDTVNGTVNDVSSYIERYDVGPVKNIRHILEQSNTGEAMKYVKQYYSNQSSLWNVLIEHTLLEDELETALESMVKCRDYRAIQFLKRLKKVTDPMLRRAEVCNYLGRLTEAEKLYRDLNRPDLLVLMYESKGKYENVLKILDDYSISDHEKMLNKCHMNMGEAFASRYEWDMAMMHFEKAGATEKLVPCYIHAGNYNALINLIDSIDEEALLCDIAHYLQSIGMIRDAVRAFIRAGRIVQAVKLCEHMSEWKTAIDLARKYQIDDVNTILDKYVQHLAARNKLIEIVEVYRKANRIQDAMSVVLKLITELRSRNQGDAILFKKLFLLIGLLYEENKHNQNDASTRRAKATLNELLETEELFASGVNNQESGTNNTIVDDPWKGAEAYHFLLLTQNHLYEALFDAALKSAMQLINYDEFLAPEQVYCLLALSSYHCKNFTLCSKAFIKLESLSSPPTKKRPDFALFSFDDLNLNLMANNKPKTVTNLAINEHAIYEAMAFSIFEHNSPADSRNKDRIEMIECKFCMEHIPDYSTECPNCNTKFMPCIASGRSIMDAVGQWTCAKCNHHAIKTEIKHLNSCPLCHFRISNH